MLSHARSAFGMRCVAAAASRRHAHRLLAPSVCGRFRLSPPTAELHTHTRLTVVSDKYPSILVEDPADPNLTSSNSTDPDIRDPSDPTLSDTPTNPSTNLTNITTNTATPNDNTSNQPTDTDNNDLLDDDGGVDDTLIGDTNTIDEENLDSLLGEEEDTDELAGGEEDLETDETISEQSIAEEVEATRQNLVRTHKAPNTNHTQDGGPNGKIPITITHALTQPSLSLSLVSPSFSSLSPLFFRNLPSWLLT